MENGEKKVRIDQLIYFFYLVNFESGQFCLFWSGHSVAGRQTSGRAGQLHS